MTLKLWVILCTVTACAPMAPALIRTPPTVVSAPMASVASAQSPPPVDLRRVRFLLVVEGITNNAPGTQGLAPAVMQAALAELRANPAFLVREARLEPGDAALGGGALPRFSLMGGLQELTVMAPEALAPAVSGRHGHHRGHSDHHRHHPAAPLIDHQRVHARVDFVVLREPQHAMLGTISGGAEASGIRDAHDLATERARLTALSVEGATRGALRQLEAQITGLSR